MKYKILYWLSNICDWAFTYGGTAGVIIYNYCSPDNSDSFKITMTGVVLIIALLYTCKTIFEHNYQNKQNSLLQQLGSTSDENVKEEINKEINRHKMTNEVYRKLMTLLPFIILYIVTYLGAVALQELNGTVGLILCSMGLGSVAGVIKVPLRDKANIQKFAKRAIKK